MSERLLIVEDEDTLRESLCRVFQREGYEVVAVGGAEAALELFEEDDFDLVVTDVILPGITGIELIKRMKTAAPEQPSIVMTAYASLETAVETLRAGAYDYIVKPIIHEEMKQTVRNALRMRDLQEENLYLKNQIVERFHIGRIIGVHPDILRVKERASQAAEIRSPVLLVGEVGTGKGLAARVIYHGARRSKSPFLEVNCSALSSKGQEEAFFLRSAGSADGGRGALRMAKGGTVYLKRVEALSHEVQGRLLSVLLDGKIQLPGERRATKVDALLFFGTEQDPGILASEGKLHPGLYEALKASEFRLPPLRERGTDVDELIEFFLQKFRAAFDKPVEGVAPEVRQRFGSHAWPGNVLELRNLMEHAVLLTRNHRLGPADFPSLFGLC